MIPDGETLWYQFHRFTFGWGLHKGASNTALVRGRLERGDRRASVLDNEWIGSSVMQGGSVAAVVIDGRGSGGGFKYTVNVFEMLGSITFVSESIATYVT